MTGALLLLAAAAFAQSPPPLKDTEPPKASTAAAVSASTATVAASTSAAVAVSTAGVHAAPAEKPRPKAELRLVVHPEAKKWEPVSLRATVDSPVPENGVVLRQGKSKGQLRGSTSKAKASARVIKSRSDRWLVISIFPKTLEKKRAHFEIRFRAVEGFVEDVKVRVVTIMDSRPDVGAGLDSDGLRAEGVEFQDESPASAQVVVSALDARPGKAAFNAGALKSAEFSDRDLGTVSAIWSVRGLSGPK